MTGDGLSTSALHAAFQARPASAGSPLARSLVARDYGRRDWSLRRLLALSDTLCLAAAMAFTVAVLGAARAHSWQGDLPYGLITLPAWVGLFKVYGLYERDAKRLSHSTLDDLPSLFHCLLSGCLLMWCWFALAAPAKLMFAAILMFGALAMALVPAGRVLARAGFLRLVSPERVLLIGTGQASGALIEKMCARASLGLRPIGMVSCGQGAGAESSESESESASASSASASASASVASAPSASSASASAASAVLASAPSASASSSAVALLRLGRLEEVDLPDLLAEQRVDRVVVADVELGRERLLAVVRDCRTASVKVCLLPLTFSALGPAVEVDDVQGITVLGINPLVLSRSARIAKRALDLAGAGLLSVLALPLLLVLAAAIKLDSPGPVFFRQERIGRGAVRFRLVKLRTMSIDAEARRAELLAQSRDPGWLHLEHDPRITRVGRLLRLSSLDELPQLWNVLRGDMSLVGPRPLVAEEDRMVNGWARGRLDLTPGITGLWQVLGRTSIPFEEMVKLDYLYVTNWSLWSDVRLILRTLPVVLRRSGAN